MKKINLLLAGFFVATLASAQVKLSLSLLPDGKTYQVSMLPETTWEPPLNTTGSVQVVVAAPDAEPFMVKDLQSKIEGITWLDDSYVDNPAVAANWQFISFTVKELGSRSIPFKAGEVTPLFTFQRTSGHCSDKLMLLDNNDPIVKAVVKNNYNITQNITVLGMRGNAFSGVAESKIECAEMPAEAANNWISNIKASPIPAGSFVDFYWVNAEGLNSLELQLINEKGQIIQQHRLNTKPGAQSFHAELADKAQGIYSANFIANGKQRMSLRLAIMP